MSKGQPQEGAEPTKAKEGAPPLLYVRQVVSSFGGGLMNPYVSVYAIQLGAGPSEMGWLRSLNNLFSNLQVPWGTVSDRVGRYVPFVVLGGVISALLWLPMLYATSPWQLILIVAAQAIANSMVAPAWAALLGRILPKSARGSGTANINAAASLGTISATLLSGVLVSGTSGTPSERYRVPLLLAAACGLAGSLVMLGLRERKMRGPERKVLDWKVLTGNRNFRLFVTISVVHQFFMSMAWPLFPITIVNTVKNNMLQVAYLSVISGSVSLLMQRYAGRVSDRAGRKPSLLVGRSGVVLYALIYAFSTSVYHLYVAELVIGVISVLGNVAAFAYLLDITEEEQRGASVAIYNTLTGFSTFLGSIVGGYLVGFFGILGLDPGASLQAAYMVSAAGRLGGGLLFAKVSEQYVYPSTMRKELVSIMAEDAKRTKYLVNRVEKLGEKAELDLWREMDRFGYIPDVDRRPSDKAPQKEDT